MKSVLITGAGGFAGSALLEHLRQHGYEVIAGVRNRARKLALEQRFIKALVCDVTDPIAVARVIAAVKPDSVVHLAGLSRPYEANTQPLQAYQSIVTAWANICDAVRRTVPRSKVLLVSACDVYGNNCQDGQPISETTEPTPISTFGSLKATAETIAHTFFEQYHLNVTIARPFHHTGPKQSNQFFWGAVASRLANWDTSSQGTELRLPDLGCYRDILHVADVIEAYEALLLNGRPNETYNVSSGQARTCREIVEKMVQVAGLPLNVVDEPMDDADNEQIPYLCGANEKICTETGWSPTQTVDKAVTELVHYYQSRATVAR